jgi:hypothetical protein
VQRSTRARPAARTIAARTRGSAPRPRAGSTHYGRSAEAAATARCRYRVPSPIVHARRWWGQVALADLTKTVLATALAVEMEDYLGDGKYAPAG